MPITVKSRYLNMIIRLSNGQFIIELGRMDGYLFEALNLAAPAPNGGYQSQFKQK